MIGFTYQPQYRKVDTMNTVLIGVNHSTDSREDMRARKKFMKEVLNSDHLVFEGNSRIMKMSYLTKETRENYEFTAFKTNPSKSIFLEEEFDPDETYSKHGVPKNLGLFYESALFAELLIKQGGGGYINIAPVPTVYSRLFELNPRQTYSLHNQWINFSQFISPQNPKAIMNISDAFFSFSMAVRDYELIGPGVKKIANELAGKKTIITGSLHTDFIYDCITGKELSLPMSWKESLAKKSSETRKTISELESVLV